jgi:hypothetical protein
MSYQSCTLDGIYVLRWGKTPELPDVDKYCEEIASAKKTQGVPLVALIIMPEDSDAPDGAFRKAQAARLNEIMGNLRYAICVFEGEGFLSSLKRSALVGILLLSGRRYPVHVRASIREALVEKPPEPPPFNVPAVLAELGRRGFL